IGELERTETAAMRLNQARLAIAQLAVDGRDMLAAPDADGLEAIGRHADHIVQDAATELAAAAREVRDPAMDAQAGQAHERLAAYRQALDRLAGLRRGLLDVQARQLSEQARWDAEIQRLRGDGSLAGDAGVQMRLSAADAAIARGRGELWRYQAMGAVEARDAASEQVNAAVAQLTELGDLVAGAGAASAIQDLQDRALTMIGGGQRATLAAARIDALRRGELAATVQALDDDLAAIGAAMERRRVAVSARVAAVEQDTDDVSRRLGALVILLIVGNALWIGRHIGRPIVTVTGLLRRLSDGDLAISVPYTARGDEIGDVARAATVFKDRLTEMAALRAER